jgi:hypothetical protein
MATRDEIWKFGDGHHRVHTTSLKAYEKIKSFLGITEDSYYKKNGKVFAWDVTCENKKLPRVKKILKEYS